AVRRAWHRDDIHRLRPGPDAPARNLPSRPVEPSRLAVAHRDRRRPRGPVHRAPGFGMGATRGDPGRRRPPVGPGGHPPALIVSPAGVGVRRSGDGISNERERQMTLTAAVNAEATETPRKAWTLVLASLGLFMVALDTLVVTTALPVLRVDLGASLSDLEW